MKLDEWLTANNETRSAFARRIGSSPGHITDLCNGRCKPLSLTAQRIMEATEGGVRPEDFFGPANGGVA